MEGADLRPKIGQSKPEKFNFLGFTHICGKKRSNRRFTVLRQTIRQRLQAKLGEVKAELKRCMHDPVPEMGKWLRSVVEGHIRYYDVPMNFPALRLFRFQVDWLWHRTLSRRSQNGRVPWDQMRRLIARWLPVCASVIPIRCAASASLPKARARCGKPARHSGSGRGGGFHPMPKPLILLTERDNPAAASLQKPEFKRHNRRRERQREHQCRPAASIANGFACATVFSRSFRYAALKTTSTIPFKRARLGR
jgi:hypothetical protein